MAGVACENIGLMMRVLRVGHKLGAQRGGAKSIKKARFHLSAARDLFATYFIALTGAVSSFFTKVK